jgi:hypothetical protein
MPKATHCICSTGITINPIQPGARCPICGEKHPTFPVICNNQAVMMHEALCDSNHLACSCVFVADWLPFIKGYFLGLEYDPEEKIFGSDALRSMGLALGVNVVREKSGAYSYVRLTGSNSLRAKGLAIALYGNVEGVRYDPVKQQLSVTLPINDVQISQNKLDKLIAIMSGKK